MTDATVLSERESYIVAQALYEFIRTIEAGSKRRQSQDAKALMHARFDNELAMLVQSNEVAGREPRLLGRRR